MGVSRDRECCEMIMIRSSSPACIGPVEVIARESGCNRMVVQLGNGPGRSPGLPTFADGSRDGMTISLVVSLRSVLTMNFRTICDWYVLTVKEGQPLGSGEPGRAVRVYPVTSAGYRHPHGSKASASSTWRNAPPLDSRSTGISSSGVNSS